MTHLWFWFPVQVCPGSGLSQSTQSIGRSLCKCPAITFHWGHFSLFRQWPTHPDWLSVYSFSSLPLPRKVKINRKLFPFKMISCINFIKRIKSCQRDWEDRYFISMISCRLTIATLSTGCPLDLNQVTVPLVSHMMAVSFLIAESSL